MSGEESEKAGGFLQRGDGDGDGDVVELTLAFGEGVHDEVVVQRRREMATSKHVIEATESNFATEVLESQGLTMVDFWAAWCGPCRLIAPTVEELAEEYKDRGLKVAQVDVDTNAPTAARFGIRSIPAILFFKNGKVVDQAVGVVPKEVLERKILNHL